MLGPVHITPGQFLHPSYTVPIPRHFPCGHFHSERSLAVLQTIAPQTVLHPKNALKCMKRELLCDENFFSAILFNYRQ